MRKYLLHILIISFVFLLAPSGCNISKFNLKIDKLQSEVRKNPDDATAHYNLGIAHGKLGMYKEAIKSCKQAIRIDPDFTQAHYNLGVNYGRLGMYKEVIEAYKQAIRIDPDFTQAHYNLGAVYAFLDDRDSALGQYEILKSLDSRLANKLFNIIGE